MDGLIIDIVIVATFVVSIVGTVCAVWRLEYAKKQYEISRIMLEESRKYWESRLSKDEKCKRRT